MSNNNEIVDSVGEEIASVQKLSVKDCPTKLVTVYSDRAEVTRNINFTLPSKGTHEVVVEGLIELADKNSVRVSGGKGNAVILEVSVTNSIINTPTPVTESQKLEDEKKELENELNSIKDALERVEKEAKFIQTWADNAVSTGCNSISQNGQKSSDFLSTNAFEDAARFLDFYTQRLERVDNNRTKLTQKNQDIKTKIGDINKKIATLNQPKSKEQRVVSILIHSDDKSEVSLQLSYLVTRCSWIPSYDCRVATDSSSVQLVYYGNITNSTGEDWSNVHLNLSTAKPSSGGNPPSLATLHVEYPSPASNYYFESNDAMLERAPMVQSQAFAQPAPSRRSAAPAAKPVAVLTAQASKGASSTTFSIPRVATVASDNKSHKVTIALVDKLQPRFTYTIVASKTKEAYLKVSATNTTTDCLFLSGSINVFMDNNFVCTSNLQTVNPGEDFALHLGTDASVRVDYKPVKKTTENAGWMGKVKTQRVQCCTTVKNTNNHTIAVVICDQLPLSHDDYIKVKPVKPTLKETEEDIRLTKENNIEWRYQIEAGKTLEVPFSYEIEYPKDKEIEEREY